VPEAGFKGKENCRFRPAVHSCLIALAKIMWRCEKYLVDLGF